MKETLWIWAAHFSRSSGAVNTVLFTIETFNEHSGMAKLSQSYLFMFMFICHIANREAPLKGEVSS